MFFDGSLQDGIALALQEQKVIVCLITCANDQSRLWADEYLQDDELVAYFRTKAIALRIEGGSTEAGYLAAFYPISTLPTIVVVHEGHLLADLHGDINFGEFKQALLRSLEGSTFKDARTTASQSAGIPDSDHPSGSFSTRAQLGSTPSVDPAVQTMLDQRRRRLDIDKKEKEALEKAERRAKQETQRAAADAADPNSRLAKQHKYAQLQKRRQLVERQERERILKVIENDKVERKHTEDMRKALAAAQAESELNDGAEGLLDRQLANEMKQQIGRASSNCAVQVRLFDGTTIRSTFPSGQTLGKNVRQWIDEQRADSDVPYTFRQILAPLSNRPISISEEEESLQSLGLTPSATLVMVPVQNYSAAYDPAQGYLKKGLSVGYNLVSGSIGLVTGAMGSLLGVGNGTVATTPTGPITRGSAQAESTHLSPGMNIRTLRDRQANKDEQQLYNGNQLNFEPRRDDNKED